MDHVAALATLTHDEKTALQTRSNSKGLLHLASYLAAILVTSCVIVIQGPLWWFALVPHGILLVFLFTLSHEATHQTPFANPRLNECVGHTIAPIIALPFLWFRYFHLAHHKHTNDPDRDPEIAQHPRPDDWGSYALYLTGWSYWRGMVGTLWRSANGRYDAGFIPKRQQGPVKREARIVLSVMAIGLSTLLFSDLALWLWIIPVLIGQPFLRIYLLAEHGLCPPVANMLENTRTTFTNRFIRWLAWNMPYHIEHHAAPNVPFHQLPKLHAHLAPYLVSTSDGYRAFTVDFVRQLDR